MTTAAFPAALDTVGTKRAGLLRRFLRRPLGVSALGVLLAIAAVAVLAPWLSPYDPNHVDFALTHAAPGHGHLLGGDSAGRDIFSRLLSGARTTLYGGLITVVVATVLGVPPGIAAGYFRGALDRVFSWISDAFQAVPGMLVLLIVAAGTSQNFGLLMAVIGVLMAPGYYRISRSIALAVGREPYIDAARVSGVSNTRILGTHLLRAVWPAIIVQTALTGGLAIGMQAGLQFLGIGAANTPSWGQMMNDGFQNVLTNPLILLWPSLALGITIAALAFLGSTLADLIGVPVESPSRRLRAKARRVLEAAPPPVGATTGNPPVGTTTENPPAASGPAPDPECALRLRNLRVAYAGAGGIKEVVRGVSIEAARGEVLGIVGESGSGKSQTIFSILDLLPASATAVSDGLWIGGREVSALSRSERSMLLGRSIGYVPQEPMANLDPCYTIAHQLIEPLRHVHGMSKAAAKQHARKLLLRVGIHEPDRVLRAYPHQLSGGMAQRVLIAGAVAGGPSLLVADEPTTALDVTVQAEVLELLRDLQHEYGMALIIVTHNFGVVADVCDRVVVMRDGAVVETGSVQQLFRDPQDPYTAELIDASLDETETRAELDQAWCEATRPGPEPAPLRTARPDNPPLGQTVDA